MSKLAAIKRQIAALEAEAERIARQEMSGAIAKVKEIMSTFGLTIEHLQAAVVGKGRATGKSAKRGKASGGAAKYADPKTGKTWSGFGRAPGWIAGAKNRDAFLVDKAGANVAAAAAKAPVARKKPAAKKASAKKASARKAAKPVARKAVAAAKKAVSPAPASAARKKASVKKAAAKKPAKKRSASSGAGAASAASEAAAPSAS